MDDREPMPYAARTTLRHRKKLVKRMLARHPDRVPIIIERSALSKGKVLFSKVKFMISRESTVYQLIKQLQTMTTECRRWCSFMLMVTCSITILPSTVKLGEVYDSNASVDGFLYLSYIEEEVYG